ncbi:helix-turn-helix domain-containing protein [Hyunsoonleella sp. 2307UL5-6]|uniref:helix-turn-helix domain-containing protein n=1 Tax=Hyunsoonleella sp. 2307UL5-6 TaxID=3384768 RepID=UPI0039BC566F
MAKQILQIENEESKEYLDKIENRFKSVLHKFYKELGGRNADREILLTREETAKLLSISLPTLWKYTKDDVIPAYRIGSKVRYKKSEILLALKKMNQF